MRRRIVLCAIVSLLSLGCAGQKKFEEKVNSWVGADVNRMISSWGPPARSYQMPNGHTVYTWEWSSQGMVMVPIYGGGMVAQQTHSSCTENIEADEGGTVVTWQYQGNHCW